MAYKVFLDANVILDSSLQRHSFEHSKKVFDQIREGTISGFTMPSILQISSYLMAKELGHVKTKQLLLALLANVISIDCPHEIVLLALNSRIHDIEDAIQYYKAMHHKMDYFISLDKKLVKEAIPSLPVLTPMDFIAIL